MAITALKLTTLFLVVATLVTSAERRVVQITWLRDAGELERKKKRNGVAQFFKGIFRR